MENLSSAKRFENLLDLVAADQAELHEADYADDVLERAALGHGPLGPPPPPVSISGLGLNLSDSTSPCPTWDSRPPAKSMTMLGPPVGDDNTNPSDVRLKEDVQRVGTTVFGLTLYHFKYIGAPETYEGVMAHEVLQVMPDAVSRGEDGYYRVNYSALGTRMRRVS